MIVTLELPKSTTSLGIFLNYNDWKRENTITTTNWLTTPNDGNVIRFNVDGTVNDMKGQEK